MDDILRLTLLFDFYGELLTDKQKLIFEMYHLNDLSLAEIGEDQGISRQAVRDQLKRTEKALFGYEEKLRLLDKFMEQKSEVRRIKETAEKIEKTDDSKKIAEYINDIMIIADSILD